MEISIFKSLCTGRRFSGGTGFGVPGVDDHAIRTRNYLRNVDRREDGGSPNAEPGD